MCSNSKTTNNQTKIMGLIKIFSGSEILALGLQEKIEAVGINAVVKNNIQSARMGGFGSSDLAVEVFIQQNDYGKVHRILEDFRMSL